MTSKDYFEDKEIEEQVVVRICGFGGVRRGNYFGKEPVRTEVEVTVEKLKNEKAAAKDKTAE